MRRWTFALLVMLWEGEASAQAEPTFSANQFSEPSRTDGFVGLEPSRRMLERFQVGGRVSYLYAPVSLRLGAPSETPTRTAAVSDLLLAEAAFASRILDQLDAGVVLPWHAYQAGSGLDGVSAGPTLNPTALGDVRLTVGYSFEFDEWALRPFLIGHLPTGNTTHFAGEGVFHGEVGFTLGRSTPDFEVALDMRGHFREPRTLGLFRLGNQLRIGLGGRFRLGSLVWLGIEGYVAPGLEGQPAPDGGSAALALPAELLLTAGLELDRWLVGFALGAGLPLGHLSSINGEQGGAIAPGTPALRTLLDVRYQF